jgi:hypothetical protein
VTPTAVLLLPLHLPSQSLEQALLGDGCRQPPPEEYPPLREIKRGSARLLPNFNGYEKEMKKQHLPESHLRLSRRTTARVKELPIDRLILQG